MEVVDDRRLRTTASVADEGLVTITQSSFINLRRWGHRDNAAGKKKRRWIRRRQNFFTLFNLRIKVPTSSTLKSGIHSPYPPSTIPTHCLPLAVIGHSYQVVFRGGPVDVPGNFIAFAANEATLAPRRYTQPQAIVTGNSPLHQWRLDLVCTLRTRGVNHDFFFCQSALQLMVHTARVCLEASRAVRYASLPRAKIIIPLDLTCFNWTEKLT